MNNRSAKCREILDRLHAQLAARLPVLISAYTSNGYVMAPEGTPIEASRLPELASAVRDYLAAERDFAAAFPSQSPTEEA